MHQPRQAASLPSSKIPPQTFQIASGLNGRQKHRPRATESKTNDEAVSGLCGAFLHCPIRTYGREAGPNPTLKHHEPPCIWGLYQHPCATEHAGRWGCRTGWTGCVFLNPRVKRDKPFTCHRIAWETDRHPMVGGAWITAPAIFGHSE